ncbi:MAG: hypothetical protein AAB496_02060 [Patescibacteria group bacterium]
MLSSVEEQLKSGEYLSIGWPWRIFSLFLIIFIIAILVYAGINFGYRPYLNKQIKILDAELLNLNQSIDKDKQNQLILFYSQIVNIGDVLNSRDNTFQIFDFLEKNTYPEIKYANLSVNAAEKEIKIDGTAPNYEILTKEMTLLDQSPQTERVILENSRLTETSKGAAKEIRFNLKLILTSEFFK